MRQAIVEDANKRSDHRVNLIGAVWIELTEPAAERLY